MARSKKSAAYSGDERQRRYRARKTAVTRLASALQEGDLTASEEVLWSALIAFEGYPFRTAKGLQYQYITKGNEVFFSRKEKSVTRASVLMAFKTAVALQRNGIRITGPKMLKCFGASYLYPVFRRLGVIACGEGTE